MSLPNSRIGGDVVIETLRALGADKVIGLPGQHALGLFDALRRSDMVLFAARVENNAGFMADGLARATGQPAPLLLSTGPGALTALPALMESRSSSVPVIAISAQIPTAGLGGGRHGYLHELAEQSRAFEQVVKSTVTVRSMSQIPSAITEAWRTAATAPQGPVLVEIPQDILLAAADDMPQLERIDLQTRPPKAPLPQILAAARWINEAARPVVIAGGGAARADASKALLRLAEAIDAPIFSTFSGRNAVPTDHELNAGSWLEDIATTEYLEQADLVVVVGSALGELSSNYHTYAPRGRIVQIDADLGVIGSNHTVLGLHADARDALEAIVSHLDVAAEPNRRARRITEIQELAAIVAARIGSQGLHQEQDILAAVRSAVPPTMDTYWDMTMLAYWAWSAWDRKSGQFVSPQGAGGLGHAFPAALGAAFGSGKRVLAVSGDGGAMYGIAELTAAVQAAADVTWLIIDDGGYGILEEYMTGAFGIPTATELVTPDFVALAEACGVPAVLSSPHTLEKDLADALQGRGPNMVVLPATIALFAPTHLERL